MTVLKHQNKPIPRPAPFSVSNPTASPQTPLTTYSGCAQYGFQV